MNKISYIICLTFLFLAQTMRAQEASEVSQQAKLVKIEYQSIDEYNKPVTLSAIITVPSDGKAVSTVILSNTTRNHLSYVFAAQGKCISPWNCFVEKGVAVVEPENFVAGDSKLRSIPKFTYNLAGRQTADALFAAVSYLKENGMIQAEDYKSYIIGFGLGANIAIAAQKSLETDFTAEEQAELHLKNTYYANPSDAPSKIWKEALRGDCSYSAYNTIVMLDNMLKSYAEGCMKTFTEEDVFSQRLLDSHILDYIYSDGFTECQIKKMMLVTFGSLNPSLDKLVSKDMLHRNSAVRRAVEKALDKNVLATDSKAQKIDETVIEGWISQAVNYYINQMMQNLENTIISAEDLFLSVVFTKMFETDKFEIPVLLYYSSSIYSGSISVDKHLDFNLNLTMYSLFLVKTADIDVTVSPNIISTMSSEIPGKIKIGYYNMGWIGIDIDASNVIPVVQNITGLLGDGAYETKEEADKAAEQMNSGFKTFDISINEIPKFFTGSFGSAEGSEGKYKIDLNFNRDGKSISLATIQSLL